LKSRKGITSCTVAMGIEYKDDDGLEYLIMPQRDIFMVLPE
jgi:hypothetical protein